MNQTNLLDDMLAPALTELDPTHAPAVPFDLTVEPPSVLLSEELRFVSAKSVNSFIGYRLMKHEYEGKPYINWTLAIGSCDEVIHWHGESAEKIDMAIAVMEKLRAALKKHAV